MAAYATLLITIKGGSKMRKTTLVLTTVLATLTIGGGVSAQAATKVPVGMRHAWYQKLKDAKDPEFIKLMKNSIDSGSKAYHTKLKGARLQVIKKSGGWYQIGARGITNPTYKLKKLKIGGTKRTVLLKKYSKSSHYASVYLKGKKTVLPLANAEYFLK